MPPSSEVVHETRRYFDIKHDGAITSASGFWCEACLIGKPGSDTSPDPRYCQGCYGFLLKEAEILPQGKRPAWIPRATRATVQYENQHQNLYQAPWGAYRTRKNENVHSKSIKRHSGQFETEG